MCGIAGIVDFGTKQSEDVLRNKMSNMLKKIAHRGPDGEGISIDQGGEVCFGHRRLSIVDLSASASQPMRSDDGRYTLVFNGEIYNHSELRKKLISIGASFKTDHSDTEVLLNGFIEWGIDKLLSAINGMFSFAIHDTHLNTVILARDRVGIKPIYYHQSNDLFLFCSEIKGILAADYFDAELDTSQMGMYIASRSLPAPYTLFKNINKLKPGHVIEIEIGQRTVKEREYWNPLTSNISDGIKNQSDFMAVLDELIDSSIDYRLAADVNVGMFLSGGIDSNYLLSKVSKKRTNIKCFTATFPENDKFDESVYAKEMAKKFNAEMIEVPISSQKYMDVLEEMIYFQEEPISAPVCVPVYELSKTAREHDVPVILAGEGSDEVLIGYENWLKIRKLEKLLNSSKFLRLPFKFIKPFMSLLSNYHSPSIDLVSRAALNLPLFFGGAMDVNEVGRMSILGNLETSKTNSELFEKHISEIQNEFLKLRDNSDVSSWMTYTDLHQRLPELMLPRLDRMGMAFSIEGRVPYLDHRIVELVMSLPEEVMSEQPNLGKSALKQLAEKELGYDFVYRRKQGFQAPVAEWKDTQFKYLVECLLEFSKRTNLFDTRALGALVENGGRRYFSFINFMFWYLIYIENVLKDKLPQIKSWRDY